MYKTIKVDAWIVSHIHDSYLCTASHKVDFFQYKYEQPQLNIKKIQRKFSQFLYEQSKYGITNYKICYEISLYSHIKKVLCSLHLRNTDCRIVIGKRVKLIYCSSINCLCQYINTNKETIINIFKSILLQTDFSI